MNIVQHFELEPVSGPTLSAYGRVRGAAVDRAATKALSFEAEVAHLGQQAESVIIGGLTMTSAILESIMAVGDSQLLIDQVHWVQTRLPHDNLMSDHIVHRVRLLEDAFGQLLSADHMTEISPYFHFVVAQLQAASSARSKQ